MSREQDHHPEARAAGRASVSKWRVAGWVLSSVVIVAVSIGYAVRGLRLLEQGEELRGLVNLVGVGLVWLLLTVSASAVIVYSRRRKARASDLSGLAK